MGRHSKDLIDKYFQRHTGYLYQTDEELFETMERNSDCDTSYKTGLFYHASDIREIAFSVAVPHFISESLAYQELTREACDIIINSPAFAFPELIPMLTQVWITPEIQQERCWDGHSLSPGEENLFLMFWAEYYKAWII